MTQANHPASPLQPSDTARPSAARPRPLVRTHMSWRGVLMLIAAALAGLALLGAGASPPRNPLDASIDQLTAGLRFDLVQWEMDAVSGKLSDLWNNPAAGLEPAAADRLVRDYLAAAQRAGQLESEIERAFSDLPRSSAETVTTGQREELAAIRQRLTEQAGAVEAVLEGQTGEIIRLEGLDSAGVVWPPPRVRFSEPPQLLVVSPRERIERLRSVDLAPDLDTLDRSRLETAVTEQEGLSAYVTGIGGYGLYPTMVVDRNGLLWTAETIAHEWIHNYLTFRPLGWDFLQGGDAVTINETVASIAGDELGQALVRAYYPDLAPQPRTDTPQVSPADDDEGFDFGREMHATRLAVDKLLAAGFVEEAEAFMEARRQTFIENGHRLRVLNQAYFAFHGSYATGAASSDPIGPKLERLRALSPSLRDFLHRVSSITTAEELDRVLADAEARASAAGQP